MKSVRAIIGGALDPALPYFLSLSSDITEVHAEEVMGGDLVLQFCVVI